MIKRFRFDKLIRDKIPNILRSQDISIDVRKMEKKEFIDRLKEKLIEETLETSKTESKHELAEELADILEVIHALSQASDLTLEEIEQIRLSKKNAKGGFDQQVYSSFIDLSEHHPSFQKYLAQDDQYPLIETPQGTCIFCQMAKGEKAVEIFAEFKHCFVIKDQYPVSPGHLLFIPYEHTANWFATGEKIQLDIMQALRIMKKKLDQEYHPDGYNIGANCGPFAGQTVMHLHVHLIPRYKGDMQDPRGGVRGVIPEKQKY